MFVQVVPLVDVWIWKDLPYAASQFSVTCEMVCDDPRSTCSHCGSATALDQRVPVLPSTAAEAGKLVFSVEDAVAGLPCDSSVPAAPAGDCEVTKSTKPESRAISRARMR